MHSFKRQPLPIRGAGIERRHRATLPAENRFELRNRSSTVGCACRGDFANTMR
jgi:hypothetical protein